MTDKPIFEHLVPPSGGLSGLRAKLERRRRRRKVWVATTSVSLALIAALLIPILATTTQRPPTLIIHYTQSPPPDAPEASVVLLPPPRTLPSQTVSVARGAQTGTQVASVFESPKTSFFLVAALIGQ